MFDQIKIDGKGSYDDFSASMSGRKIGSPKKKSIKETIPFSNEVFDFSKINGEIYWEERTLEYELEMDADFPEELEAKKLELSKWLMNVHEAALVDPFIRGYHFLASFDEIDFDDSEIEKTVVKVKFTAYPYLIADEEKSVTFQSSSSEDVTFEIINNSAHRIIPTLTASKPLTFEFDGASYSVNEGSYNSSTLMLLPGKNVFKVKANSDSATLKIAFFEEVF